MSAPAIDWDIIRGAIADWVEGQVSAPPVWSGQDRTETPRPFVSLNRISGPTPIMGTDAAISVLAPNDAYQEFKYDLVGYRQFVVSVQAFSAKRDASGRTISSNQQAEGILCELQASLESPVVRDAFEAAGLSVAGVGDINNLDAVLGAGTESRAAMDVTFYCVSFKEAAATATYIEGLNLEVTQVNENGTQKITNILTGG